MAIRTNRKHFKLFINACLQWQQVLGLLEWELSFKHGDLTEEGAWAMCSSNMEARIATLSLSTTWGGIEHQPDDQDILDCAFHEMCELLLCDYSHICYDVELTHTQKSSLLADANHRIIHRLQRVICPAKMSIIEDEPPKKKKAAKKKAPKENSPAQEMPGNFGTEDAPVVGETPKRRKPRIPLKPLAK
jgi:hypothetical protein